MRRIGIFFAGFAAGILFLGGLLLATRSLTHTRAATLPPPSAAVSSAPVTPPPGTVRAPVPETKTLPAPTELPNPYTPPATMPPSNALPSAQPGLLLPVQGMAPGVLRDNFLEARDGHVHEALDIMAPRGTPVVAVAEGNVVKLFHSKPGGLTVYQFDDSRNWCFYYAHLDHYAKGLVEGTLVRKGDVLGYVGTTGNAPPNAPHLHFTIFKLGPEKEWWKGAALDPYPFLTGRAAWPPS